jgi:glutamine amidotransferase
MGNLLSVRRALETSGAEVSVTSDPNEIESAERLILPGVGAFADGMRELGARGLTEPIRRYAASGRPLLGICLGMHLLMDESAEFGSNEGLGVIPGRVVELPRVTNGRAHKVPHIGWSAITRPPGTATEWWQGSPLESLDDGVDVYFVHSYVVEPEEAECCLAEVNSDEWRFPAALRVGAITGTQFHPEKSGPAGLRIVKSFVAA